MRTLAAASRPFPQSLARAALLGAWLETPRQAYWWPYDGKAEMKPMTKECCSSQLWLAVPVVLPLAAKDGPPPMKVLASLNLGPTVRYRSTRRAPLRRRDSVASVLRPSTARLLLAARSRRRRPLAS